MFNVRVKTIKYENKLSLFYDSISYINMLYVVCMWTIFLNYSHITVLFSCLWIIFIYFLLYRIMYICIHLYVLFSSVMLYYIMLCYVLFYSVLFFSLQFIIKHNFSNNLFELRISYCWYILLISAIPCTE